MKIIININAYDYVSFYNQCYIVFNETITEVGYMKDFNHTRYSGYEIIDGENGIVIPGFVNCHTHIYSTFSRGINLKTSPKNFKDILDQLWWKIDKEIDLECIYSSAMMYGLESIYNGVTTVVDHNASGRAIIGSLDVIREALNEKLGIRCVLCYETSDRFDIEECLRENLEFREKCSDMCMSTLGMHASMSICEKSMKKIVPAFKEKPIHLHCSESDYDEADSFRKYGVSVIQRLNNEGLLNDRSLLAHCVHIKSNDFKLLQEKNPFIVINLSSNMNNAVGLPDIVKFQNYGVKVLIGTDGLGSNMAYEYINFINLVKHLKRKPDERSIDYLFDIIKNGYDYIESISGLKLGKIKEGYKADLQLYDYKPFTEVNERNIGNHIVYGVYYNLRPDYVFVNGKSIKTPSGVIENEIETTEVARINAALLWSKIKRGEDNS